MTQETVKTSSRYQVRAHGNLWGIWDNQAAQWHTTPNSKPQYELENLTGWLNDFEYAGKHERARWVGSVLK